MITQEAAVDKEDRAFVSAGLLALSQRFGAAKYAAHVSRCESLLSCALEDREAVGSAPSSVRSAPATRHSTHSVLVREALRAKVTAYTMAGALPRRGCGCGGWRALAFGLPLSLCPWGALVACAFAVCALGRFFLSCLCVCLLPVPTLHSPRVCPICPVWGDARPVRLGCGCGLPYNVPTAAGDDRHVVLQFCAARPSAKKLETRGRAGRERHGRLLRLLRPFGSRLLHTARPRGVGKARFWLRQMR